MKKPFVVGDRVSIYGFVKKLGLPNDSGFYFDGQKGKITQIDHSQIVITLDDRKSIDSHFVYCHKNQLRHLIKKERRRFWVNRYLTNLSSTHTTKESADKHADMGRLECIEVIEVRKKK